MNGGQTPVGRRGKSLQFWNTRPRRSWRRRRPRSSPSLTRRAPPL